MNCVRKCGFTDCFFHAPISLPGAILVFTVCGNANQFELITGINTVCFYVLHGDILFFFLFAIKYSKVGPITCIVCHAN